MKTRNKILLATNLSRESDDAVGAAIQLVNSIGGEVELMNVLPSSGIFGPLIASMEARVREQLQEVKQRCEKAGCGRVTVRIVKGDTYHEIVSHAETSDVSLVMLGGGYRAKDLQPRLGTTAERLMRQCYKPVWIVRPGGPKEISDILCPVDMSAHSVRAARNAIRLCRHTGASLHVVHVVCSLSDFHPSLAEDLVDETLTARHFSAQERDFEALLSTLKLSGIKWRKSILRGEIHTKIIEQAGHDGSQLIVMGSQGWSDRSHLLMGSVASKVSIAFPCSILMVKDVDAIQETMETTLGQVWRHYERGQLLLKDNRAEEAIEQFKICIGHNRLFSKAWFGLADAYDCHGNQGEAARCREIAGKLC